MTVQINARSNVAALQEKAGCLASLAILAVGQRNFRSQKRFKRFSPILKKLALMFLLLSSMQLRTEAHLISKRLTSASRERLSSASSIAASMADRSRFRLNSKSQNQMPTVQADFPEKLRYLFEPSRYKVAYGGRGAGKSWGIAQALLILGTQKKMRILCARETMKSIEESVHQTLCDRIAALSLGDFYRTQLKNIVGANGTEFFFAGVRQSVENIKSYEDVDVCWCEEAQAMSRRSLSILIPTIRKEGSEIWFSFNPEFEDDEVYKMFVVNRHDLARVININWRDNPWFTDVLKREMEALRKRDADECDHVYEGTLRSTVEGAIYKKEIQAAEKEQRVTRVPWDSAHPVHTFWDLGFGDCTAIWFAQSIGFEFRIIDYESGELNALAHYVKQLKERPYAYGQHWLPWDGAAKELGTGRSVEEQLGEHFGKGNVHCARKLTIEDGIAATRAIFGKCYFDAERCKDGLRGLRCYQYEYDKDLRTYSRKPLHDWASHPADGFRTLGVAIREQAKPKEKATPSSAARGIRWG